MTDTLPIEERLPIIEGRLRKVQLTGAVVPPPPASEDAARLHLLIESDAPWLLAQVTRLLREHAAATRRIAALHAELGETQAKVRRQAGALTAAHATEGRRVARGRRL